MVKSKILITVGMVLLVLIPIVIFAMVSVKPAKPGQYDKLAQCLAASGVKMYGAYSCSHCQAQKKAFGTSFKYIKHVECVLAGGRGQTKECEEAGIKGYPTWVFGGGERVEGEVSIEQLAEKSGCEIW